jgi:hypothetical protein
MIDKNHILMASLYGSNQTAVDRHGAAGERLRSSIIDLFWDPIKVSISNITFTLTPTDGSLARILRLQSCGKC